MMSFCIIFIGENPVFIVLKNFSGFGSMSISETLIKITTLSHNSNQCLSQIGFTQFTESLI